MYSKADVCKSAGEQVGRLETRPLSVPLRDYGQIAPDGEECPTGNRTIHRERIMVTRTPQYRRDRRTGQAVVRLSGKDVLLGEYDSPVSHAEYRRQIAEWQAAGADLWLLHEAHDLSSLTVEHVVLGYRQHCEAYYRTPDDEPGPEIASMSAALRPVVALYGHTPASEFSPLRLKAVRYEMIRCGRLCRKELNRRVKRISRCFRWASENELVPAELWNGLRSVSGLRYGRVPGLRESPPILPVPEERVYATLPFLSTTVAAMVRFQLATGCRPGEVCVLRRCDVDMSGEVWVYRPHRHKTQHHGHERRIYVGPRGRDAIRELAFGAESPTAYVFSPQAAMRVLRNARTAARKTPLSCGNRVGTNRKKSPKRAPGERYTTMSYGKAISKACAKAFPYPSLPLFSAPKESKLTPEQRAARRDWRRKNYWQANQLRHTAASRLRREIGLEAARVVLGHRSSAVTEVYAEIDFQAAESAIARFG